VAGRLFAADSPASSTLTRELLGWHLSIPVSSTGLDQGHYSHNPSA